MPGPLSVLRSVVADRWDLAQVRFTPSGLLAWYVAYVAFRNLKGYLPFVNERLWDTELARLDRVLWLGHDPAAVLHEVLGTGWAAWLMSGVYVLWIGLVPAPAIALVWTRRSHAGELYVTAISFNWLLGVAVYYLVPSLGPVYSRPSSSPTSPPPSTPGCRSGCCRTASTSSPARGTPAPSRPWPPSPRCTWPSP